jgi:hypothetical protein
MTEIQPHTNFHYVRWSRADDDVLSRRYAEGRSPEAIAHELGRTRVAVQVRASKCSLKHNGNGTHETKARPSKSWRELRELMMLVAVGQRWPSFSADVQAAFLEKIGAVRRNGHV